jgi:hypothetical protein
MAKQGIEEARMNGHQCRATLFGSRQEEEAAVFQESLPPELKAPPEVKDELRRQTEIIAAILDAENRMRDPLSSYRERLDAEAEAYLLSLSLPQTHIKNPSERRKVLDEAEARVLQLFVEGSSFLAVRRDLALRYPALGARGIDQVQDIATRRFFHQHGELPWAYRAHEAEEKGEPLPPRPRLPAITVSGEERLERMRQIAKACAARVIADPDYDTEALATEITALDDGALSESESVAAIAMGEAMIKDELRDLGILTPLNTDGDYAEAARRRIRKPEPKAVPPGKERRHRVRPSLAAHGAR